MCTNAAKAMTSFEKVSKVGIELNIMGCNGLVKFFSISKRKNDSLKVFEVSVQNGVKLDDRIYGCLLSVVCRFKTI